MSAALSDIFYWWLGAIREAFRNIKFPRWLAGAAPFVLKINKDGQVEFSPADPVAEVHEAAQTGDLGDEFRRMLRERTASAGYVTLRLDARLFFVRAISPLNLPASRLAKAAVIDLRANTPFKEQDVHILGLEPCGTGARYAVIKRSVLDPIVSSLCSSGLHVHGIELETDGGCEAVSPASIKSLNSCPPPIKRRLLVAAASTLAAGLVITALHAWYRNDTALQELNRQIESLTAEAKVVRAALDKRAASLAELKNLRDTIENAEPLSGLWEELARVLPDSAYLTDLDFKEGKVIIAGYAAEAASLVVALEQSPKFEQASFTAPVVRAFDQDAERFQVSLLVEGDN